MSNTKTIKSYANQHGWSDVYPYEVIRVIGTSTVEVRKMDARLINKDELLFIPGGFSAHCPNGEVQKYEYTSNPEFPIERIRWSKANNCWQQGKHVRFYMSDTPRKFYDYNF